MKRIFTLFALFVCAIVQAQTPFVTQVAYRGAFAPAPTAMWTTGWTNFDPQNAPYSSGIDSVINTSITTNYTLSGTKKYLLQGLVYVTNNATLTINAGCLIKGDHNVANSSLIITRGAKINAKGLSTKPIVFTSAQPVGSRSKGDWGGIILLGKASYNGVGGQNYIEGIAQNPNTQYGGGASPNDDDTSGTMQYVRIEFGGYIFAPNQEINGLTFGAVGRGTTIDHIQVSYSNDDSYEWFGGTVNCKYLVAYKGLDDNWDTDNGFSGTVQFGLGIRDPQISDNPLVSTSEGYESDNDAAGSSNTSYTKALFTNMTDIGPLRGNTSASIASGFRRNVRIRRNSHLRILNSIMMDFPTGVYIDGAACVALATTGTTVASPAPGNLVFKNNLFAGQVTGKVCERNVATFDIWSWFGANKNDSVASTSGILVDPYATATQTSAGDFRPAPGSPALTNVNFADSAFYYAATNGTLTSLIACPASVATPNVIYGSAVACSYIGSGDTAKYYLKTKNTTIAALRYEWTVPIGATLQSGQGSDTIIVVYDNSFPAAGGYITVKCQTYCGVYSAARSLLVKRGVPGTAGIISGPAFICDYITNGDSATYTVPALLYATSYLWTAPTGATIAAGQGTNSIKVMFDNTFTTGSITVKGVAACGQSAVARAFVLSKVSASPGLISGKKVSCGFLNTTLTYSIPPVANASSYIWTVPVGASITGSTNGTSINVVYTSPAAGNITVKSVTSCGQSAARSQAIAKVGTPVSISGSVLVCSLNNDFTYTVNDTLNNLDSATYTWTVPVGATITSGQNTSSITVAFDPSFLAGSISVKAAGCGSVSAVKTLAVSLDPACKGRSIAKSSITNVVAEKLVVSPNPSKGNFTVYYASKSKTDKGTIQISNVFGQVVSQRNVSLNNGIINEQISENKLAPGIYSVKCTIGSETKTTKIVVQ